MTRSTNDVKVDYSKKHLYYTVLDHFKTLKGSTPTVRLQYTTHTQNKKQKEEEQNATIKCIILPCFIKGSHKKFWILVHNY